MKRALLVLGMLAAFTACGGAGGAIVAFRIVEWTDSYPGPLELVVTNTSVSELAMTELRAVNDAGCAVDVGTTGSNYSQDQTLASNEAFVVAESTCNGMAVKNNNEQPIRFAVGLHPTDSMSIYKDMVQIDSGAVELREGGCTKPQDGVVLCVRSGALIAVTAAGETILAR